MGAAIMLATSLPGCTGCNQDPLVKRKQELDDIDKEKKKKEPKKDFEIEPIKTVPADDLIVRPLAKPGHWLTTFHEIKANNFNFSAQLVTSTTDERGNPFPVDSTSYVLQGTRPAKLAKGQARRFETTHFVPRAGALTTETVWFNGELRASRGGRLVVQPSRDPMTAMPGYQYYFMVLSSSPGRYGFLQRLSAINTPTDGEFEDDTLLYYRVLQPVIDRFVPLPSNPLTWTCVSYVLLDDLDPSRFTPAQQQALLDWLHWGGQVIISGPNSLDKLKGSFLEDYLPAQSGETVEIDAAAIAELNDYWSLPPKSDAGPSKQPAAGRSEPTRKASRKLELQPQVPLFGVALTAHPDAAPVAGTAQLVWERRIGQGRIVATSFSLTDRYLMNWGASYDSFFNGCVLRRPRREFVKAVIPSTAFEVASTRWVDLNLSAKDSRLITTQRYFTRDVGHYTENREPAREPGEETSLVEQMLEGTAGTAGGNAAARRADRDRGRPRLAATAEATNVEDWHNDAYPPRLNYGMGAWNDRSGASDAARQALEDAAGISIPQGDFVLRVLALYLLVLAPLNWGLFRMIGRVEWAWAAAPLIAIVGAFVVVRTAQLDIGFARSVTEVVVAEVHGDYPRALVTRYSAMYTSLSTGYDFVFEDDAALAQPLGDVDFKPDQGATTHTVTMHREGDLRFGGIQVASNSIGYMHSEQHADLGGVFALSGDAEQGWQISNGSRFNLSGAGILRGEAEGLVSGAWVGELPAGARMPLAFETLPAGRRQLAQWDQVLATLSYRRQADALLQRLDTNSDNTIDRNEAAADAQVLGVFDRIDGASRVPRDGRWSADEVTHWCRQTRAGEVSVGQLVELASQMLALPEGEVRLIAWSDDEIPGMTIRPDAAQVMRRTLFVVHLKRAPMTPAVPDRNGKADVTSEVERPLDAVEPVDDGSLPIEPAKEEPNNDEAAGDEAAGDEKASDEKASEEAASQEAAVDAPADSGASTDEADSPAGRQRASDSDSDSDSATDEDAGQSGGQRDQASE